MLVSTGGPAGAEAASGSLVFRRPPPDRAASIEAFLDRWHPDAALALGLPERSFLFERAAARKIPLLLAAGRRGAFAEARRAPSLLRLFEACFAPSAADARALERLNAGAARVVVSGPLSDTALALPCDDRRLAAITAMLAARPVWLAARVTLAEMPAIEAAQRRTIRAAHRLLLVVVPRDPADGAEIARSFTGKGWRVAMQSRDEEPNETIQIFVADGPEDLGLWYRLAPISVLGGSFDSDAEVADPFEAAALGSAIVHGPHVGHSSRFERLRAAGATVEVARAEDLGDTMFRLLSPEATARLAHAGWSVTSESAHVVERLAAKIDEVIDAREVG